MDIVYFIIWYILLFGVVDGDQIQRLLDLEVLSESLVNFFWFLVVQNNRSQLQFYYVCGGVEIYLQEQLGMRKYFDDRRMFVECKGLIFVLGMLFYKNNEFLKK